jgi:hypothetical protein
VAKDFAFLCGLCGNIEPPAKQKSPASGKDWGLIRIH